MSSLSAAVSLYFQEKKDDSGIINILNELSQYFIEINKMEIIETLEDIYKNCYSNNPEINENIYKSIDFLNDTTDKIIKIIKNQITSAEKIICSECINNIYSIINEPFLPKK